MGRPSRYSPEVRERAVRMVWEHESEHASQWAAISSIAGKMGCTAETLRRWVRQAERDQGRRPGLTTDERQRLKELERENPGRSARTVSEIGSGSQCCDDHLNPGSIFRSATRNAWPRPGSSRRSAAREIRGSSGNRVGEFTGRAWRRPDRDQARRSGSRWPS